MNVVGATEARTITTAVAVTTALAAPSQGSIELCNWRVRMEPGATGPLHSIDHEQLWTVLAGSLTITCGDRTDQAMVGQTVILPAGVDRQVTAGDKPVDVLVCMPVGGMARVPGDAAPVALPWAQ
jgi:quercetin dioxygenase-like cupin family protein